ncbi:MAG: M48 family metallopeptidase [Planctomycetia bacterium]|nr:M48 family metallopeptidase [Planctomycetia bacterium]
MDKNTAHIDENVAESPDLMQDIKVEGAQIDDGEIMPPDELAEVKRYNRISLTCGLVETFFDLAFWGVAAFFLAAPLSSWLSNQSAFLKDSPALLGAALLGLLAIFGSALALPLSFFNGYVVEKRFGLSTLTPLRWFKRFLLENTLATSLICLLAIALYLSIVWTGQYWIFVASSVFFFFGVVLGMLAPVLIMPLFYKVEPLQDDALLQRFQRLVQGVGLNISGVYRLELSTETNKANACLAGFGATRRVLLGDTLLENFTPEEIEAVFAHEVGHHVRRHMWKLAALMFLVCVGTFFLADFCLKLYIGEGFSYAELPPSSLTFLMFVMGLIQHLCAPLMNAISRRFERQSDAYACETSSGQALASAFVKLARQNKADPDPSFLEVWWMHSHPAIGERIRSARGH